MFVACLLTSQRVYILSYHNVCMCSQSTNVCMCSPSHHMSCHISMRTTCQCPLIAIIWYYCRVYMIYGHIYIYEYMYICPYFYVHNVSMSSHSTNVCMSSHITTCVYVVKAQTCLCAVIAQRVYVCTHTHVVLWEDMQQTQVSFAKEPYKRADILQKSPMRRHATYTTCVCPVIWLRVHICTWSCLFRCLVAELQNIVSFIGLFCKRDLCLLHVFSRDHVYFVVCYPTMGWLRLVGSLKLQVSFAKEPYKRDYIL